MKGLMHKQVYDNTFRLASIRTRLLLIVLVLMFMSLGLFTAISYYFSDKALTKSVNSNAAVIGADYANRTYGFLKGLTVYIKDVAANPHIVHPENKNQIVEALADSLQRNHHFSGMNYIDLEGNMTRADGSTAYIGNREYYKKVLQTKRVVISEPILSRESGRKSLAISAPIMYKGQLTAVIQGTMPLDSLMKFVNKIKFMDTGYGFIINQSGVIIAHKLYPEMNGKINLLKQVTAGEKLPEMDSRLITLLKIGLKSDKPVQGIYDSKYGSIFTVLTPLNLPGGARWLVAVSAPEKEVTGPISSLNKVLLLTAFGCILMGTLIVFLISKRFARPEEKYFKAFKNVADAIGIINLENERIIEVNDAFYKTLGYERKEVVGKTSRELNLWDDSQRKSIYGALRREESVYGMECFWYTKNRNKCTGMLSADAIKIGDDFYAVFIWHDITVQKQSELKLKQAYDAMEQKVEERTQELFAANQELTAMNEEMTAINEELAQSNNNLHEENHIRQRTEDKLLLREKQYRATTNLLLRSTSDTEQLMETILANAIQLVEAEAGFIGSYITDGQKFVIHYGMGKYKKLMTQEIIVEEGPLKTVYNEGRVVRGRDRWQYIGQPEDNNISMIFVPLKQNQIVKGLLAAAWGDKYEISLEDVEVLQQFADLAFLAMEKEQTQQQIRHIAFNDMLTNLPNRISLNTILTDVLEQARNGGEGGILFSIDLDDFKTVNDTFGHSAGDKVIIAAGKTLQDFFTENASVFRVSSDEFIVIMQGSSDKGAAADIAERLLGTLCQEYDIENEQRIQLSASVGLVLYPQQGDKPEGILKKADAAMYAAKTAGRNCWRFFTPELLQKTAEDTMMINRLHRALIRNELFLQYQPQMTVDGSRLIGLEALLRWDSPDYGLVSPGRFIPLAERSWLIVDIGKWVLQRVCNFARILSDMGKSDIRIAVNISPRQIKDDDFVECVRRTIKAAEISPQQIEIEVTESVLMENLADNVPKLKELQNDGVSLALDDFGTGFSSLTYLRTLPVNCLKIDKSFIDRIAFDNMQMRVVASIVELGHTLGMEIVAEGVETQEQLEKLRGCSCDYIQGYIFSKPIDEKEAVKFCLR